MKYIHKSKRNYFEGWYFKHISNDLNISFIPSVAVDENKNKTCYLQVITEDFSHTFTLPFSQFFADKKTLNIKIGNSIFTDQGIYIDIEDKEYQIKANLIYGEFTRLKSNIMGILNYLPLECKHGIISMKHLVTGNITINEKKYTFNNDLGYIETDYGTSFPENYTWLQCNDFPENIALVYSHATIPFLWFKFTGFLSVVIANNKEYRFTSYNFSKLKIIEQNKIQITKRKYKLDIYMQIKNIQKLQAPKQGKMDKVIYESINGKCELKLFKKNIKIVSSFGKNAGIEINQSID